MDFMFARQFEYLIPLSNTFQTDGTIHASTTVCYRRRRAFLQYQRFIRDEFQMGIASIAIVDVSDKPCDLQLGLLNILVDDVMNKYSAPYQI